MTYAYLSDTHLAICVRRPPTGAERPLRLAFLLDISDSMEGERMAAVKQTLAAARDLWCPTDTVTVVTFGETAQTVLANHRMDEAGCEAFYEAVGGLATNGCTNLGAGLEELAPILATAPVDMIVLLTDGDVNRGMTSTQGLLAMALALGAPVATLGYGSDHNRQLLRDLALRSRSSYTVCDTAETLPAALGTIMAEMRSQVVATAALRLSDTVWDCEELGALSSNARAEFTIGSLVPDRDYWSVWTRGGAAAAVIPPTVTLICDGVEETVPVSVATEETAILVEEQLLRSRTAALLQRAADALEHHETPPVQEIGDLLREIDAGSPALRGRGLVLRLRGEIAAALAEFTDRPRLARHDATPLMARLSSQTAYLSTQRGGGGDPNDVFSPQHVRTQSSAMRARFVQSQTQNPGSLSLPST
jgi:hypothetical protein